MSMCGFVCMRMGGLVHVLAHKINSVARLSNNNITTNNNDSIIIGRKSEYICFMTN